MLLDCGIFKVSSFARIFCAVCYGLFALPFDFISICSVIIA